MKRKAAGESNYQIAARLGLSEGRVRVVLKRLGYVEKKAEQTDLDALGRVKDEDTASLPEPSPSEATGNAGHIAKRTAGEQSAAAQDGCRGGTWWDSC